MSDDRNFKEKPELDSKAMGEEKIKRKALFIKYLDVNEIRTWHILFNTKFGEKTCVYTPHNEKWKSAEGKAKGVGHKKMLNYFRPFLG